MSYARASSLSDAIRRVADGAVILAGGTALVPELIAQGRGPSLVDITGLATLRGIRRDGSVLVIGSLVTLAELTRGAPAATAAPEALLAAASEVANPHVRGVGTVGGNIAVRSPNADLPPALIALAAEVVLVGPHGDEQVPIDRIAAEGVPSGRLIAAVRVPLDPARRAGFRKVAWRRSSGRSVVSVGVGAELHDRVVIEPRLVVAGICRRPQRLPRAEARLSGRPLDADAIAEAAAIAAEEVVADVDAPPGATYRRRLVAAGLRSALSEMVGR